MKNEPTQRITYAQKFLLDLVEKRELRSWCLENNLDHPAVYRIAVGERVPSYKIICSMVHLIPPAHWVYFSDEEIPYEVKTVPQWDASVNPTFILKHKRDYKYLAERYEIQSSIAQNIFVHYRTKMSIEHMRMFANEADPLEFFTLDASLTEPYVPERGDIISLATKTWIVLSKKDFNLRNNTVFAVEINEKGNGIEIQTDEVSGKVDLLSVGTISYSRLLPVFLGKTEKSVVVSVIKEIGSILK